MSDTALNQILDRIGTINHRLDMMNQRANLFEQLMASRMQAFEANQRSLLLQSQTVHLLSQTRDAGTLLNVINQQRLNDIVARIARLECEHSSRPNPT